MNEEGAYYDHVPLFAGKFVLTRQGKEGNANAAVIEELERPARCSRMARSPIPIRIHGAPRRR